MQLGKRLIVGEKERENSFPLGKLPQMMDSFIGLVLLSIVIAAASKALINQMRANATARTAQHRELLLAIERVEQAIEIVGLDCDSIPPGSRPAND